MPQVYSLVIDSFLIKQTRSLHEDTDYVSFTLAVIPQGGQPNPQTITKSMGSINDGTHVVNLQFENVSVDTTDTVILNYIIFNAGASSRVDVETTLEKVGALLVTAGASLNVPPGGSALAALVNWLPVQCASITHDRCDGAVAAEQKESVGGVPGMTYTQHTGNDSPVGCGQNSLYIVNWHSSLGTSFGITPVIDLSGTWASGGVPGPVVSVNGNSLSVDMSHYNRSTAAGTILDSSHIAVTFPDDNTYTGTLQPPNTIQWSNNSAWTKV